MTSTPEGHDAGDGGARQTNHLGRRIRRRLHRMRSAFVPWSLSHTAAEDLRAQPEFADLGHRDAVAKFQVRNGLPRTGELDAATRSALAAYRREHGSVLPSARLAALEAAVDGAAGGPVGLREQVAALSGLVDGLVRSAVPVEGAGRHLLVNLRTGPRDVAWLSLGGRRGLYVLDRLADVGLAAYEPSTLATVLALLEQPQACFADVGANVGIFSHVVRACRPDVPVVGFEPTPDLAAVFGELVDANDSGVQVEQLALGAEDGSLTLYLSPTDTSNSLRAGFRAAVGEVEVEVRRFDSWFAAAGVDPPTVVKIDTESTEPDVLRGAEDVVRRHRPWLVVEVLHGRTEDEINTWCQRHDYRPHHIVGDGPEARDEVVGDATHEHLNFLLAPGSLPDGFRSAYALWHERMAGALTVDLRP